MELSLSSLALFLSFIFLFLLLTKTRNKSKTLNSNTRLPPGPWKLPIIGSMHRVIGQPAQIALRNLSRIYGPVMHVKLGAINLVVISSSEAAREVMKTKDLNFASRPELLLIKNVCYGATNLAFAPYGDYWRQLRKICILELLSAKRVRSFSSLRREEVLKLVSHVSSMRNSPVNLSEMFLCLTNTVTCRASFGEKCKQEESLIDVIKEGLDLILRFSVADLFPSLKFIHLLTGMKFKLDSIHQRADEILDEIITERQANSTLMKDEEEKDLLDVLLRIKEHGDLEIPLTMNNIKAVILDMFTAGTKTSAGVMEATMAELIRNPKVMDKVQAEARRVLKGKKTIEETDIGELSYMKQVIKETLRLHPPLKLLLPRECRETCQVGGYTVPVGTRVAVNAWALGRDPDYWDDAETFKPERFEAGGFDFRGTSFEYVPFGAGRRICPGATFGLASVELVLAQLLFHFDWEISEKMKQGDLDNVASFGGPFKKRRNLWLLAKAHLESATCPVPA